MSSDRVRFALCEKKMHWMDFLNQAYGLAPDRCLELRSFGALYLNQLRWHPTDLEQMTPGSVVRAHLEPRRFPLDKVQNQIKILQETDDWLALNKPSGLPSHETLDNQIENIKSWFERRHQARLWSLNRLDVGTSGVILFAKNPQYAKEFHLLLSDRKVEKIYAAISPPSRNSKGLWRHWMKKTKTAPKELSIEPSEDFSLICELEILDQQRWRKNSHFFESKIRLETGRTHQIRAQFAFEGAPLIGDRLYKSQESWAPDDIEAFALACQELEFPWRGRKVRITCEPHFFDPA